MRWEQLLVVTEMDFLSTSSAAGVSRVNDWLLKINDIDLTNKDRKQVVKAVLNGGGSINMVVRRRKSLGGRLVTPVHINLAGHKGQLKAEDVSSYFSVFFFEPSFFSPLFWRQTVGSVWRAGCLSLL